MNVHMHAHMFTVQTIALQLYNLQLYENSDPGNVIAHLGWFPTSTKLIRVSPTNTPTIWSEHFLIKTLFSVDFLLYEAKN